MLRSNKQAQTAVEYMLLLAIVVGDILIALPGQIPRVNLAANTYFDRASNAIYGRGSDCGDGVCDTAAFEDNNRCCDDCGGC